MRKYFRAFYFSLFFLLLNEQYTYAHEKNISQQKRLIELTDPVGQKLLISNPKYNQSYWKLSIHSEPQAHQKSCAVASSVIALNALGIKRPTSTSYPDFPYHTQKDFFFETNNKISNPKSVLNNGMRLDQLHTILNSNFSGLHSTIHEANNLTVDSFRDLIKRNLSNEASDRVVLINYDRKTIGQNGGGHVSPAAAYDPQSDRILILDVAHYKYPPVWIKTKDLYESMLSKDSDTNKSRGLLVLRNTEVESSKTHEPPELKKQEPIDLAREKHPEKINTHVIHVHVH